MWNLPDTANATPGARISAAREGTNLNSYLAFSTNNGSVVGEKVRINSSGNVGIGTTSPTAKLDVNGTANFQSAVSFAAGQTFPGTATLGPNSFVGNQTVTGSVGIGTTTPTNRLNVIGSVANQPAANVVGVGASSIGSIFSGWTAALWGDSASGNGLLVSSDSNNAIVARSNTSSLLPTAFIQNNQAGGQALAAGGPVLGCIIYGSGSMACGGSKSAEVPLASGRRVLLYAIESPQVWFEDFGSGVLAAGVAAVVLDPVFAETVNPSITYRVFLTPRGDCEGLYVASQTPVHFEVRELRGGKSNVAFDYRIVARPKGYENVRLEDVTDRSYEKTRSASAMAAR